MNVAVPASRENTAVRRTPRLTIWDQLGIVVSGLAILFAILILIYGLVLAIRWYNQPFFGAILYQNGVVLGTRSLVSEPWPAINAGILTDDRVEVIDGVPLRELSAGPTLNSVLAERAVGDTVTVQVFRYASRLSDPPPAECARLVPGGAECTFRVQLGQMPGLDFLGFFGLGYLVAVLAVVLGAWVWSIRREQTEARSLTVICVMIAVAFVGRFEITATYQFALAMKFALVMTGAVIIQLAMYFPYPLAVVRRIEALRWLAPVSAGSILVIALLLQNNVDPRVSDWALLIALAYLILSGAYLVLTMAIRRRSSISVLAREQATIVLWATIAPLIPGVLWWVTNTLERLQVLQGVSFSTIYLQPPMLIFPLGLTYAILIRRPVDTDRVLSDSIVLTMLGAMLVVGYLAITGAAVALTSGVINFNSPILIAVTLFIVALLFTPARVRMERLVDNAFFRQRREYERRLESFARSLTMTVQTSDVVGAIQSELNETLTPQYTYIFLQNMISSDYEAVTDPKSGKMQTDIRFRAESGLLRLLNGDQSVIDLERDAIPPAELQADRPRLAVLNTPVLARLRSVQRLNGFIALGPRRDRLPYSHEDLRFLEGLANQAAAAFERAQMVLEAKQNERELQVLVQVSQGLNIQMDFDTLLEFIATQIGKIIPAPYFFIVLRDLKTEQLYYAFYQEEDDRLTEKENQRWPIGRDLMSEVIRTQQPYRTDNYVREMQRRDSSNRIESMSLHAWMGVPLNASEGPTLGCLVIASPDPNVTYNDAQMRIFKNIADLAATALFKLRLLNESTQLARQMQVLNETSSRLATLFEDIDALLQNITESAVEILDAEAGSLLLMDDNSNDLVFRLAVGGGGQELVGTRIPAGSGIAGTVVVTGHSVIVNDPKHDPRWFGDLTQGDSGFTTRSILAVPLSTRGKVIGVLEVINKQDGSGFDDSDTNLLTAFAGQAAVAIENANLFRLTDEALAERVKQLFNMQRIDQELNRTLDLQRVVDLTVDNAIRESEADAGLLALVSTDPPGFQVMGSAGYPERIVKTGDFFDINYGILGRVYRNGESLLILNPQTEIEPMTMLPSAENQLAVPLITTETVTGVLLLESTQRDTFTPMTTEHIQGLAEHANTAITNAQLFAQLGVANQARLKFMRIVAHELGNPMASIKGYAEVLIGGMTGPLNDRQQDFVGVIRRNVVRMQQLVEDLRDFAAQETGNLKLKMATVNFHSVVLDSVRPQQRAFDEKEQAVQLDVPEDLPKVWGDEGRLIQIMTNFLSNANKYTPKGGTVTITAECVDNMWDPDGAPRVVHCAVRDTGIGMSQEDLKHLFTPYWRSGNPMAQEQQGTGLGMSLTRGLIEAHGGKAWVESTLNVGTVFHFTVPVAMDA